MKTAKNACRLLELTANTVILTTMPPEEPSSLGRQLTPHACRWDWEGLDF